MSYSIARRIQFCAGHRIVGHESKCRAIHGHNYIAFIHARPQEEKLDELGRVIDFGVLKEKVGGWIDRNWDHGMIMWSQDPYVDLWKAVTIGDRPSNDGGKYYLLGSNPTAENMAQHLLDICQELFEHYPIEVYKVVLWETENCHATATLQAPKHDGHRPLYGEGMCLG